MGNRAHNVIRASSSGTSNVQKDLRRGAFKNGGYIYISFAIFLIHVESRLISSHQRRFKSAARCVIPETVNETDVPTLLFRRFVRHELRTDV